MKSFHATMLCALLLSLGACQTGTSKPDPRGVRSDGFPAPSRAAVWEAAHRAVVGQRYTPDTEASSKRTGLLESRWRNSLTSFSREGFREKVTVRVLPIDGRDGFFRTETNVTRQENENVSDPSNPVKAEWSDPKRVAMAENLINRRIEMFFLPGGISDQFRNEHGMQRGDGQRLEGLPQHDKDSEFWKDLTR